MSTLQNILKKTMQGLGDVIEKVGNATQSSSSKKNTVSKTKSGFKGEEGQDFSEISWDDRHLHALLLSAERSKLLSLIPKLEGKTCLHITTDLSSQYLDLLEKRGAERTIELNVSKSAGTLESDAELNPSLVRGSLDKLPFQPNLFDCILYPSTLAWRSDLSNLIPEAANTLANNGRLVISTVHPFFEYLISPRGGFRKNIGTLFSQMKQQGFFVDEVKEIFLEDAMRMVSLPADLQKKLQSFKGMPIVLFLRGILIRKRKK